MLQSTSIPVQLPLDSEQRFAKVIALKHGYITLVDAEDYEWLMQWTWRTLKAWKDTRYALRSVRDDDTCQRPLS